MVCGVVGNHSIGYLRWRLWTSPEETDRRLHQTRFVSPASRFPKMLSVPVDDDVVEVEQALGGKVKDKPWTPSRVQLFIDLMVGEVVMKNKRPSGTFTKDNWSFMRKTMAEKTKYNYDQKQIRYKFNKFKQIYKDFTLLLKTTGVTNDPVTSIPIADEETWTRLEKINPQAKIFKKKGCPYYDQLCTIYRDSIATGENAHPATKMPSDYDVESANEEEDDGVTVQKGKEKKVMVSRKLTVKVSNCPSSIERGISLVGRAGKTV